MWRVLALESHTASQNMAIDEAIGREVAEGRSPRTIRFYTWKAPGTVSIGLFQCMKEEVDIDRCRSQGIDFVRRRTGGGAVFHDPEGEITYSIIAPEDDFPKGIRESYGDICGLIIKGLSELGIDASFRPINDVVIEGKKISGSAQTRRHGVLTQHGTVLYRLNRDAMFSVLKPSRAKLVDKPIKDFGGGVTCISELCAASKDDLYNALLSGFTASIDWRFGVLTENEKTLTAGLIHKYVSDAWNFSR